MISLHNQRNRILALDGGGIRGFFTIEILARIELLLRQHYGNPELVLSDHFQMIAGTSTGAIIGTFLSTGCTVDEIRKIYLEKAASIFQKTPIWLFYRAKYRRKGLADFLRDYYVEKGGAVATLGSELLRTRLLLVMRNASTGSSWPVTNNPKAKFNQRFLEDGSINVECNLDLPLWQLIRASAAAPWYYPPEMIVLGDQRFIFVDGGITPYNNPSQIAFLMATLPCYGGDWKTGRDKLHIVSVGTGRTRSIWKTKKGVFPNRLSQIRLSLAAFADSVGLHQDMACRVHGECLFGAPIDMEVGDLIHSDPCPDSNKKFTYARYNKLYSADELAATVKTHGDFGMDNLRLIPLLTEAGTLYAREHVRVEHLL